MADLIFLDAIREQIQRLHLNRMRRHLRDLSDPLNIPELTFKQLYRINKNTGHWILTQLGPHMRNPQIETTYIPKTLRIFTALEFLGQGSYQRNVGQDFLNSMSQASVSRCLTEITDLIVHHLSYLIKFPSTEEEKNEEKLNFLEMNGGFPGIVGCIDCTQISIIAPKTNDELQPGVIFYCRKGFYSLNVQIVCNSRLKILNINARFPGSAHDAAIWHTSLVKRHLSENYNINHDRNTYLLGDAGYPLEPWLLTPIQRPVNVHEQAYNNAHKTVRNVVERCNGVLKQRFRCLCKHRVLNYKPERSAAIIYSCAILHNLCIIRNDIFDDYAENGNDADDEDVDGNDNDNNNLLVAGRNVRNRVIQNYF